MRTLILAGVAMVAAAPASAQVALTPGQGVSVTIEKGKARAGRVHAEKLGDADLEAAGLIRDSYPVLQKSQADPHAPFPAVPITNARLPAAPVTPGQIALVFDVIDGKESVLVVRNGYAQGLTYRATITARGQTAPTDVCLVMPGKLGYEHWPYAIDSIALSEMTLADWKEEDGVPCR